MLDTKPKKLFVSECPGTMPELLKVLSSGEAVRQLRPSLLWSLMKGIVNVKSYCEKARKVPSKNYCIDNVRTKQTGVKPRNKRSLGIHYCIFFFDRLLEGKENKESWRYRMEKKKSFMTATAAYGITESTVDDIIAGKVLLPDSLLEVPLVLLGRQQMKKARRRIAETQRRLKRVTKIRSAKLKAQREAKEAKQAAKRAAKQAAKQVAKLKAKLAEKEAQLKALTKKRKRAPEREASAEQATHERPTYESEKLAKTMVEDLKRRRNGYYFIDV